MRHITRVILILPSLISGFIHRTVCAATTAKLSVSAVVETRCSIRTNPGKGRSVGGNVQSDCSDQTQAAITIRQANQPSAGSTATTTPPATPDGNKPDSTVTY
jgi:hypothetical protein